MYLYTQASTFCLKWSMSEAREESEGLFCRPFIVASSYRVAILWSPTVLTSDPWLNEVFSLHTATANWVLSLFWDHPLWTTEMVVMLWKSHLIGIVGHSNPQRRLAPTTVFSTFKVTLNPSFLPHASRWLWTRPYAWMHCRCSGIGTIPIFVHM